MFIIQLEMNIFLYCLNEIYIQSLITAFALHFTYDFFEVYQFLIYFLIVLSGFEEFLVD